MRVVLSADAASGGASRNGSPLGDRLEERVQALCDPDTYPEEHPRSIETRETHMSWVFLTETHAYKLKKPVRDALRDLVTAERRRESCALEVELNRPLAPGVYRGVVALMRDAEGRLRLGEETGQGRQDAVVDWLVAMRRLPEHRMLDRAIEEGTADTGALLRVAERLVAFYRETVRAEWTPEAYRKRLAEDLEKSHREIAELLPSGPPPRDLARAQHAFIEREATLLGERVESGRIVEAHGDLRPEHVCLEPDPVIIDRLELARRLRLLDTVSELAFLCLECERLGDARVGRLFRRVYGARTDDRPPDRLWHFYRSLHACTRAALALGHLRDDEVRDREKWVARAEDYVDRAHASLRRATVSA